MKNTIKSIQAIKYIFLREIYGYFATPVAYVFMTIFLMLAGLFTFYLGNFFERGQADLVPFFEWHPWLFLFLMPAISMRLWSEERRSGTIELLITLPINTFEAVMGKFLAAWLFIIISLLLTFPIWITVNYLGEPDNGLIIGSYIGSILMAGGYLSIGSCISALTKNQVIAFVLSISLCFMFTVSGLPIVLDFFSSWAGQSMIDAVASFSFLINYQDITRGIIDLRSIIYFVSLIFTFLYINVLIVDSRKDA